MLRLLVVFVSYAVGVHVAFIAPPASHYVPMLPIAHALLEDGHNVTFLGYDETVKKLARLVPNAALVPFADEMVMDKSMIKKIQAMPYGASQFLSNFAITMINNMFGGPMALSAKNLLQDIKPDVLCISYVYPIHYALGEVLGIPLVGIGWGSPMFLTAQLDMPWSAEPNIGTLHSRQELYKSPLLLLENCFVRIFGFFALRVASFVNVVYRARIGHPSPLEPWEFDTVLQHPMVAMTLPELTGGMPALITPYTFLVGLLDHPGLGGNSIAKSDDAQRILSWLDEKHAAGEHVFYFAFGSEVMVDDQLATFLADTFRAGNLTVLWANKVKPKIVLPESVFYTSFAPQRAVLQHPAVAGFLSHGGANSVNEGLMFGKPMVIMPFFGDQMAVAIVQQELGVALVVPKTSFDPQELITAMRRIAADPFQSRSRDVMELNNQRKDMSRAVQVIVNQATGKFLLHIPRVPGVALRLIPLMTTLLFMAMCCNKCCCFKIGVQRPMCCRPRSTRTQRLKRD